MSRAARRVNGHADPSPQGATRRVAVYTRVSTDEQAVLEFNSLQAQEQICKTYVSMRSDDPAAKEKWVASETYTDSGYSGGTLERPGLMRLLTDIEAKRIDTIIVYKVDRLSRSIHQFYRIWEVLQHHGVDLISATQDLNTSTSQGKLMLNMLLSFGQFEREQISERTRDKIAAARKAGRWTGGHVPLGYELEGGRLVVNRAEAVTVREIFGLYLERRSLFGVVEELGRCGVRMKCGNHRSGTERGGAPFDKTSLLRLLRNPIYVGLVRCSDRLTKGAHEAIVDQGTWDRVELCLTRNGSAGYQGEREDSCALLKGLLYCAKCGCRMTPSYTTKGNRRFRYYVCQTRLKRGAHACPTGRVSAAQIEKQVVERIGATGCDPELLAETVRQARVQRDELVDRLEDEGKALRREMVGKKASLRRLEARGDSTTAVRARIAAIEARLETLPGEIQAAKRTRIDEAEIGSALDAFGPVWEALWPGEKANTLALLIRAVRWEGHKVELEIETGSGQSRHERCFKSGRANRE